MNKLLTIAAAAAISLSAPVAAKDLSLAYFMGPNHPANKGVFLPFAERLEEASGGTLSVQQYPGGALNGSPPKQYSILLDGVADIVFAITGYTADVFPKTNVIAMPGVCDSAVSCTEALQRSRAELEKEYKAKVLALWSLAPPVLITRNKPVRSMADLQGMKIRVTSRASVAFVEALGASAVAQSITVVNQNLTNGVIDAVMIDPSAILSFKLHEPANYVTTWFPGSGTALALLMNQDTYDGLTDEERAAVDAAASSELSALGGQLYDSAGARALKVAADAGVEIIELSDDARAEMQAVIDNVMVEIGQKPAGDSTVQDVINLMRGE